MKRRILIPILTLFAALTLTVSIGYAIAPAPRTVQALSIEQKTVETETFVSGNYCVSCHLANDPRLSAVTEWKGSITKEVNNPCPAAKKIHEELYYTERLLLMIDRAEGIVGDLPDKNKAALSGYTQRYSRLLDAPVSSLDAFVKEAQTTRYQLNKVYTALNNMAEANKLRIIYLYAGIVTLVVIGSLAWGLYNTRAIRAGILSKSRATFWRVAFVLSVLLFFTLPIFRVPAVEVAMTTPEQQEAQTILDTAQRAADAADRAQARAWMLAKIGSVWSQTDPVQAQTLMDEALTGILTARENEQALWGQSLAVQEATVGTLIEMESADLIAADLTAARAREWGLPLIALECARLDPGKAAALLQNAQSVLVDQRDIYRDLQMRGIALAWVEVDAAQAAPTAAKIFDPALRSWTMRELAVLLDDPTLFDQSAEAAHEIEDPVQRARALREVATASGQPALFADALAALDGVTGAPLAYALSDLAAASGDASLIDQMDPAYPDAYASALLRIGEYQRAGEVAALIADPYERALAQAATALAAADADTARQISVPLYQDIALRDVTRKTGNKALVDSISMNYYKIQALTALGDLRTAVELAGDLGDAYPLVALAEALAVTDPQSALALMDEMSREADKAVVLQAVAVAAPNQEYFEQARGMALAGRVSGDSLAPVQASLNLAQALWSADLAFVQTALQQAYEAAQRISVK